MVKKTKIDLALDMIRENIDAGIQFGGGNADGLYGNSYHFCSSIEDMGKDFVVDIHKDQRVYLSDPQPYLPGAISQKGRKPSRLKTDEPPVMVEDYQVRKYNAWYHHQALVMMAMDYINETKT